MSWLSPLWVLELVGGPGTWVISYQFVVYRVCLRRFLGLSLLRPGEGVFGLARFGLVGGVWFWFRPLVCFAD